MKLFLFLCLAVANSLAGDSSINVDSCNLDVNAVYWEESLGLRHATQCPVEESLVVLNPGGIIGLETHQHAVTQFPQPFYVDQTSPFLPEIRQSYAMWVYPARSAGTVSQAIIGKPKPRHTPSLFLNPSDGKFHPMVTTRLNTTIGFHSAKSVPVHCWTHVVMVLDVSRLTLFVNGSSWGSVDLENEIVMSNTPIFFGRNSKFDSMFGYVDDVHIINRNILRKEAKDMFHRSAPKFPLHISLKVPRPDSLFLLAQWLDVEPVYGTFDLMVHINQTVDHAMEEFHRRVSKGHEDLEAGGEVAPDISTAVEAKISVTELAPVATQASEHAVRMESQSEAAAVDLASAASRVEVAERAVVEVSGRLQETVNGLHNAQAILASILDHDDIGEEMNDARTVSEVEDTVKTMTVEEAKEVVTETESLIQLLEEELAARRTEASNAAQSFKQISDRSAAKAEAAGHAEAERVSAVAAYEKAKLSWELLESSKRSSCHSKILEKAKENVRKMFRLGRALVEGDDVPSDLPVSEEELFQNALDEYAAGSETRSTAAEESQDDTPNERTSRGVSEVEEEEVSFMSSAWFAVYRWLGTNREEKQLQEGLRWLVKAGMSGHAGAIGLLGEVAARGDIADDGEPDVYLAKELFESCAWLGDLMCRFRLGVYAAGGIAERDGPDVEVAMTHYLLAAIKYHLPIPAPPVPEFDEVDGTPLHDVTSVLSSYAENTHGVVDEWKWIRELYEFNVGRQAGSLGYEAARQSLANHFYYGEGVEKSFLLAAHYLYPLATKAINEYESADKGSYLQLVRLSDGEGALSGQSGEDDEVFQYLQNQADKGSPEAMMKLGRMYYWGMSGMERDHPAAYEYFQMAAQHENAEALYTLGVMNMKGQGVEKNVTESIRLFEQAASLGHVGAANGLGYIYLHGQGVEKNQTKALEYYRSSAEQGNTDGIYNLGIMYTHGYGVAKNHTEAARWFRKGAYRGHHRSQYFYGKMRMTGENVDQKLNEGAQLLFEVSLHGTWCEELRNALDDYLGDRPTSAFLRYLAASELGFEVASSNAVWLLEEGVVDLVAAGLVAPVPALPPPPSPRASTTPLENVAVEGSESVHHAVSREPTDMLVASEGGLEELVNPIPGGEGERKGEGEPGGESAEGLSLRDLGSTKGDTNVALPQKTDASTKLTMLENDFPDETRSSLLSRALDCGLVRSEGLGGHSEDDHRGEGMSGSLQANKCAMNYQQGQEIFWDGLNEGTRGVVNRERYLLYSRAAKQGSAVSRAQMANMLYDGVGTEQDIETAVAAYERAKSDGDASASFTLAYFHAHGLVLRKFDNGSIATLTLEEAGEPWPSDTVIVQQDLQRARDLYFEAMELSREAVYPAILGILHLEITQLLDTIYQSELPTSILFRRCLLKLIRGMEYLGINLSPLRPVVLALYDIAITVEKATLLPVVSTLDVLLMWDTFFIVFVAALLLIVLWVHYERGHVN
eukprot:Rmarinus@m.19593